LEFRLTKGDGTEKEKKTKKKFLGKRSPTNTSDYSVVVKAQPSAQVDSKRSSVRAAHGLRTQPPSQLKEFVKPEFLKDLEKKTDRGSINVGFATLGKGAGEFEKVIEATKGFAKAKPDGEVDSAREVLRVINEYLTPEREQDFQAEWDKKEAGKADKTTLIKIQVLANLRQEAKRFVQESIDTTFLSGELDASKGREKAHRTRAAELISAFGKKRAASGSSEVQLIGGADGVSYAFKPVDKESDQTGMPQGAGAVREAMGSALSNAIREQSGGVLDFGFPQTQVVSLDDRSGALIEGMSGVAFDVSWLKGKVNSELGPEMPQPKKREFATDAAYAEARKLKAIDDEKRQALQMKLTPEFLKMKEQASQLAHKAPAKEIQKALLCNFAMAQLDIKWDNLMLVADGESVTARPFDAGAGFLSDEAIDKDDGEGGNLLKPGEGGPGYMLLSDPTDGEKELPTASEPLDNDLRNHFLGIDLQALKQTLEDERDRLATDHSLGKQVLSDKSMARTYKAIANLQEVLADPSVVTTKDLVKAFCSRLGDLRDPT
jgi:uncharacterized protein YdaT